MNILFPKFNSPKIFSIWNISFFHIFHCSPLSHNFSQPLDGCLLRFLSAALPPSPAVRFFHLTCDSLTSAGFASIMTTFYKKVYKLDVKNDQYSHANITNNRICNFFTLNIISTMKNEKSNFPIFCWALLLFLKYEYTI